MITLKVKQNKAFPLKPHAICNNSEVSALYSIDLLPFQIGYIFLTPGMRKNYIVIKYNDDDTVISRLMMYFKSSNLRLVDVAALFLQDIQRPKINRQTMRKTT